MNKKKLMTTVGSLALVGAIGVGATLAYLSDNTLELKNTFTIGDNVLVQISETNVNKTEETPEAPDRIIATNQDNGNLNYGALTPGVPYTKDPKVELQTGSSDAYLYIYVDGVDALKTFDIDGDTKNGPDFLVIHNNKNYEFDSGWKKVALNDGTTNLEGDQTLDGIYVWQGNTGKPVVMTAGGSTDSLFDQIKIDVTKVATGKAEDLLNNKNIKLKAAAVQSTNMTNVADATTQAIDLLKDKTQN